VFAPLTLTRACLPQLIGLIALDMTTKYIFGYFILILASNYFNFLGFYKILDTLGGAPGEALRQKTGWYFRIMNGLYALTLLLAFVPTFGPYCTSEKVYPPCMNWAASLFLINFVFNCVISCKKDYFLGEGTIIRSNTMATRLLEENQDGEKDRSASDATGSHLDWTDLERADFLGKKMFRKQMLIYLIFQAILAFINIVVQIFGRVVVHENHFLGCTKGGYQWLYTTIEGEMFVASHMVLICTQAVMLEQALYQVPKKLGWFKHSAKEIELADNFQAPKEIAIN